MSEHLCSVLAASCLDVCAAVCAGFCIDFTSLRHDFTETLCSCSCCRCCRRRRSRKDEDEDEFEDDAEQGEREPLISERQRQPQHRASEMPRQPPMQAAVPSTSAQGA